MELDGLSNVVLNARESEGKMPAGVASRLKAIRDRGGISSREIAQLMNTTEKTVSHWNTGKSDPQPNRRERLLTLEWIISELAEFYSPEDARLWLFAPHRLLDGDRPADRIQQGKLQDVLALIDQIRDGAYV